MTVKPLSMVAVHAHPDDESSKGAGTMAKYAAEGIRVVVATMTGGERGDVLNPAFVLPMDTVEQAAAVRRSEMAAAAEALGVEQRWMGFVDSGLPEGDPLPPLPAGTFATLPVEEAAAPLVRLLREVRPAVVTTYDPSGGYPHPDHIQTHRVTMAALKLAADPAYQPEWGPPWQVAKVYYNVGFSLERMQALDAAMREAGMVSPYAEWLAHRAEQPRAALPATARIDVAAYFPRRDAALLAHASQIDPHGMFLAVPRDIEARVWPWEEFHLASATVPVDTSRLEDDLFAGLRDLPAPDDAGRADDGDGR